MRSMDRADDVYESMCLRGFNGEYTYVGDHKYNKADIIYLVCWVAIFAIFRFTNVVEALGGLFV